MEALLYEQVMKVAHDCDRGGQNGAADADYYRNMEHACYSVELKRREIKNREISHTTKSIEELEYEMRVTISKIRGRLSEAIVAGKKRVYDQELNNDLEKIRLKLGLREDDVEVINQVIKDINQVFIKEGLVQ